MTTPANQCQHCGAELASKRAKNCDACRSLKEESLKWNAYGPVLDAMNAAQAAGMSGDEIRECGRDAIEKTRGILSARDAERRENNASRRYLLNEDCLDGMADLEAGSVDVIVTSPPYNLGVRYGKYRDDQPRESYLLWLDEWATEAKRVLSDDGSLFLNIGSKPTDPLVPLQVLQVMTGHFNLQNTIHWIKSIAIEKAEVGDYDGITQDVAIGHFKPINSPRYVNDCHEYIFHLSKTGTVQLDRLAIGVAYQDKSNIARWGRKQDVRCRGNTWFVPYKTIKSRDSQRPHPATFPPRIPELCIRLHGLERVKTVLDPFMGLGNTALACAGLGVNFIGFEIDADYLKEAETRLASVSGTR
jgi:site-specific DNA-methyltransferase (adenine-specific)